MGLIRKIKTFPVSKIVLYDNDSERIAKMGKYVQILLKDNMPQIEAVYTTDPKVAYTDVDYVFCQIRTGRMKMREQDEKNSFKNTK